MTNEQLEARIRSLEAIVQDFSIKLRSLKTFADAANEQLEAQAELLTLHQNALDSIRGVDR